MKTNSNKQRVRHQRVGLGMVIAMMMVTAYVCIVRARQSNATRRATHLLTVAQVAERSEPIVRLLCSNEGPLERRIVSHFQPDLYEVGYENDEGKSVLEMFWDAHTGRLLWLTHQAYREVKRQTGLSDRGDPAQVAWRWMGDLGIDKSAPRWRLCTPPALMHLNWMVMLGSDQYRATVVFARDTEDLVQVVVNSPDQAIHMSREMDRACKLIPKHVAPEVRPAKRMEALR